MYFVVFDFGTKYARQRYCKEKEYLLVTKLLRLKTWFLRPMCSKAVAVYRGEQ